MLFSQIIGLAASIASANALSQGFNSGSTKTDGSAKTYDDFLAEFKRAQNLPGTSGWNSIRLYTNIQAGTTDQPISAIQAAIDTKTTMLLGMWASGGEESFNNEVAVLQKTIQQYGSEFTDLVAGISVGSEDLYRVSVTGLANDPLSVGTGPDSLVNYIKQTRNAISGTALSGAQIGHVDTWDAWTNGSNTAVAENCDWIGMDTYPYFEYQKDNSIDNAKQLFWDAYDKTQGAAGGKPVWITETGWPVSGKTQGQGVASTENAEKYWQQVSCELQGNYNVWWYTLQDAQPTTPNPSFGIIGSDLSSAPLYDLSCKNTASSSSSSSSGSHSSTKTHKHGQATGAASMSSGVASMSSGAAAPSGTGAYPGGNSTMGMPSGTGVAGPSGGMGGNGGNGGYGSGPTPTAGAGASGSPSGSPAEQTGNSAAKAGSALGAGVLAFIGLAAAL